MTEQLSPFAMQKFAAAYEKAVFLTFHGNHSEGTKHLFETRLQTPMTPTFTFWRQGALPAQPCASATLCQALYEELHALPG